MANPFFVQPAQFGPGLQSLAGSVDQFGQQRKQEQAAAEQKDYENRAKQAMAQAFQSGDPAAIRQAVIEFPEIAETATQLFGFTNDQTEQVARETYRQALSEADPQRRMAILEGGIETVSQLGGQPRMMAADLRMLRENPEAFERSARAGYAALASDQEYEAMFGPLDGSGGPQFGKVNPRDFTPESLAKFRQTGNYSDLVRYESKRSIDIGGVPHVFDPRVGGFIPASVAGPGAQDAPVGVGDQPPAGQPQGRQVTTEDVARSEGKIAATKEAATQAIKTSKEAFDQIRPIKTAISNVDEAIRLIDEGANTGVIASKLPSVQEASIGLDNLQGRLGLDVIGNTTFGALSEAELRFALDTALPKNMEGPALKRWLREKQESQKKLANYLEDAATFLGKPGNTIADFIEKQKGSDSGGRQDINALIRKYAPED